MHKILSKSPDSYLGLLKKPDGSFTSSEEETLALLAKVHFPDSVTAGEEPLSSASNIRPANLDWKMASQIFRPDRVRWAINSFKPYKSPGLDGIFPALLQQAGDVILPTLLKIFRTSLAWGHIPAAWTEVRVTFIPKGGDRDKSQPKSYRPISLTSFLLKTMEKVLNIYIREKYLVERPLHVNQHAYQRGKSTESALMVLVDKLEKVLEDKEIALCAFLDIEGAFDNTSTNVIISSMLEHGINNTITKWTEAMLRNRTASMTLLGKTIKVLLKRGCPQGGVLSPLEWSLVVDSLIKELNDAGYDTQGYADDLVIMVVGKCPEVMSSLMQQALRIVESWCEKHQLSVNAGKTVIVPFTRKRRLNSLRPPTLMNKTVIFSNEVKYLGVTLDSKLLWNKHIGNAIRKAKIAMGACRRMVGLNWGPKPKIVKWLYETVVRPILTYGCAIWQKKVEQSTCVNALNSLQRLACLSITSGLSSTPTLALEAILNIPPLHVQVQMEGRMALHRARVGERAKWKSALMRNLHNGFVSEPVTAMPSDSMLKAYNLFKRFQVAVPQRSVWESGGPDTVLPGDIVWFTDGSKKDGQAGAGFCGGAPKMGAYAHLGCHVTVFQAEVFAILGCAYKSIEKAYSKKNIYIFSDSQAALKALVADEVNSKLVQECVQALNCLGETNKVTLGWVPGHCGIRGNEAADELARCGSGGALMGPEPACGISDSTIRSSIKSWGMKQCLALWNQSPGMVHSKALLTGFNKKFSREALLLNKGQLKVLVRTLTGHCKMNKHLHRMGLGESPECRFCLEEDETPIHVLCECVALHHQRSQLLGGPVLCPEDVRASAPKSLVRFISHLGLGEVL